jgi:hypothetical protein
MSIRRSILLYTGSKLIAVRCRLKAAFHGGRNATFRRQTQALLTLRIAFLLLKMSFK